MSWWRELYDDDVAALLLDRVDEGEAAELAAKIVALLEVGPGDRVLDQCCGLGSIARALADLDIRVVGVDQAASYVDEARRRAPGAELVCADACAFVAEPRCAGGFNWSTSFGYAATDAENQRMLRAAFESLAPGGRFAIDVLALPGVLRNFQEVMVDRSGDLHLIRRTRIDLDAGAMRKTWTFVGPGREVTTRESAVRLYLPHQIADLARAVGFEILELFGGVDREPLAIDSMRCVVLARRPA